MTKFRVAYQAPSLPTSEIMAKSAIVSLPVSTVPDALMVLSRAGGFKDELPTGKYIGFGAILYVEVMES